MLFSFFQLKQTRDDFLSGYYFLDSGDFCGFDGVDFWFGFGLLFLNTLYATTFSERRNQLCLVKKESEM